MQLKTLTPKQIEYNQKWINDFEAKYHFNFYTPTYEQVPFLSRCFEDSKIAQRISRLEYYLLASYPIDMGTNIHNEMHKLRHTFTEEEYKWHQVHNKLGLNCWGTHAGIGLINLNSMLKRDDLDIEPFPETDNYSLMSFQEKLDLCISVDDKLYTLLERLYAEYSTSKQI